MERLREGTKPLDRMIAMPLYEYQCKRCKHTFEKIQTFSAQPIRKCPECQGPVEKLLSAPAVQFKGTGWYATDYARKGSSSKPAAENSGESAKTAEAGSSDSSAKESKEDSKKAETKKKK
jgi:putative FmdB family regulatory protein